jgi:hypothetical protein
MMKLSARRSRCRENSASCALTYDVLASPLTTRLAVIKCGSIPSWPALAPISREKIAVTAKPYQEREVSNALDRLREAQQRQRQP